MLSIVVGMVLGVLLAEHLLIVYLDSAAAGQRLCGTQIRCRFDNFFFRYIEWYSSLTKCFVSTTLA